MFLNAIEITILTFAIVINVFGILINHFNFLKWYIPGFVYKAFYYGNLAYSGSDAKCLNHIEVSKKCFGTMYAYSLMVHCPALVYMVIVLFLGVDVNEYVRRGLHTLLEEDVPVSVAAALTSMVILITLFLRRFHETYFLQVFAKSSKINVVHYLIGITHMTFCAASIAGKTPLFCGSQSRADIIWIDINTLIAIVPCTLLYLWASYEQHQSNIILANLRKSKETGQVTDEYKVPSGRLFKYVSSPHRLCEVLIYLAVAMLMQTKTYACFLFWVVSNQIQSSVASHQWYKKTFEDYPKERYIIFPYLL